MGSILIFRYGVKINSKLDCSRVKDGKHVAIVYRRWFFSANILNPLLHVQSIATYQQNRNAVSDRACLKLESVNSLSHTCQM